MCDFSSRSPEIKLVPLIMAESAGKKRMRTTTVLDSGKKRRRVASPSTSCKNRQQTLTQIQFVPSLPSPVSDDDLREPSPPSTAIMAASSSRSKSGRKRRSTRTKRQKSTITQMDFLSTPMKLEIDEDDMTPLSPSSTTDIMGGSALIEGGGDSEFKLSLSTDLPKARKMRETKSRAEGSRTELCLGHGPRSALPGPKARRKRHSHEGGPSKLSSDDHFAPPVPLRLPVQPRFEVQDSEELSVQAGNREEPAFAIYEDLESNPLPSTPRTPVTKRKQVIPSSQSPESNPPTAHRSQKREKLPQSGGTPLKDRTTNVISPSKNAERELFLRSGKKRVCERAKSKIVVLPVAITSQGAVGRGAWLTRSQWPAMNSPTQRTIAPPEAQDRVIPSSQDDEETEERSSDSVPSLRTLMGTTKGQPAVTDQEPSTKDNLEIRGLGNHHESPSIQRSTAKQQEPRSQLSQHNDNNDEPPFSPGTPIHSSSPPLLHESPTKQPTTDEFPPRGDKALQRPKEPVLPRSLSRSDSDAVAAQLHSDMLFHSTQTAAKTMTGSFIPAKAAAQDHPSQVSTQEPTQPPQRLPKNARVASASSPEKQYIKIKSSSSFLVPLNDVPQYAGQTQTQLGLIEDQDFEAVGVETDDLNPQSYRVTSMLEPSLTNQTEAGQESKVGNEKCDIEEPSLPPHPPRLVVQNTISEPDTESSTSSTPQQVYHPHSSNPHQAGHSPPSSQTQSASHRTERRRNMPFSSSPIMKDVIWTIPDSLLESLPGPPPGWNGGRAYEDEDLRRI